MIRAESLQKLLNFTQGPLALLVVMAYMAVLDLMLRLALFTGNERKIRSYVHWCSQRTRALIQVIWQLRFKVEIHPELIPRSSGGTIVVANHHSPLDILILYCAFSSSVPHFVCRSGLEKGYPFISRYIRHRCVVIGPDAKANKVALEALGRKIAATGGVAVIFPEGPKNERTYPEFRRFRRGGLETIARNAPSAQILSVAIEGSNAAWPSRSRFPRAGSTVQMRLADRIRIHDVEPSRLAEHCEARIRETLRRQPHHRTGPEEQWISSPTH